MGYDYTTDAWSREEWEEGSDEVELGYLTEHDEDEHDEDDWS